MPASRLVRRQILVHSDTPTYALDAKAISPGKIVPTVLQRLEREKTVWSTKNVWCRDASSSRARYINAMSDGYVSYALYICP